MIEHFMLRCCWSKIQKLFYILILWKYRRVCGPSLTETSLCGAWLFGTQFPDSEEAGLHVHEQPAVQNHAGRTRYVNGISIRANNWTRIPSTCVDPAESALVEGKSPCLWNKVTWLILLTDSNYDVSAAFPNSYTSDSMHSFWHRWPLLPSKILLICG